VLKITTDRETPKTLRVFLCGKFTAEYVPELEKVLSAESAENSKVALDLANVTFVDREAMVFLCGEKSRGVAIENTPSYVTRWIEQEDRCGISRALKRIFGSSEKP
jgi:ABC-type transporter Mla MlaB component